AQANGQYSFTITDNAGNSTIVPLTITNIDKVPPKIGVDNNGYSYGNLTNKPIRVTLSFSDVGFGMATQTYSMGETKNGDGDIKQYSDAVSVEKDGTYFIHAYAKDRAGNLTEAVFGPYTLDTTPPKVAYKVSNVTPQSGDILLNFTDDATGTVTIQLPDGTVQTSSVTDFHFTAKHSGVYIIEIVDAAGNVTKQTVTVTLPETAIPQSAALPLPGMNWYVLAGAFAALALIILLILLWALRPVCITYVADTNKTIKVKKRFARVPGKGKTLKVDVTPRRQYTNLGFITVLFRRGFTKKMYERNVSILLNGEEIVFETVQKEKGKRWRKSLFMK
ncbi:MAG: hypothetical protein WCP73_06875, partial [Eubacteriales bacterium]